MDSTTQLFGEDDAASMPTLVLLPGLDGTGKLFANFLEALDLSVRTQVVSYPPDVPLGYDELERLVRAALPPRGPFVLLGESFSGPLPFASARGRRRVLRALFSALPSPAIRSPEWRGRGGSRLSCR